MLIKEKKFNIPVNVIALKDEKLHSSSYFLARDSMSYYKKETQEISQEISVIYWLPSLFYFSQTYTELIILYLYHVLELQETMESNCTPINCHIFCMNYSRYPRKKIN